MAVWSRWSGGQNQMPGVTEAMAGPMNKPLLLQIDAANTGLGMYVWNGRQSVADRRSVW
jgi:hypothetical protein